MRHMNPMRAHHFRALRAACFLDQLESRLLLSYAPPVSPRIITSLDPSWQFLRSDATGAQNTTFNDSSWTPVSLPHTWNNLDGQDGGNNYYRGIGWYRKHITPSSAWAGDDIYIKFDGANLVTDLYINGTFIGEHDGGYSAFGWDVTPYLTLGADNVIAVKVNNANNNNIAPLAGDYTMDGGLYRHVNLIVSTPEHVANQEFVPADPTGVGPSVGYWLNTPGVYLTPTNVSAASANLNIKTDVRNDSSTAKSLTVVTDVVDAAGNLVTELSSTQSVPANTTLVASQNTIITNPHLWDGVNDPYLYQAYISIYSGPTLDDVVQQPLGFRFYSISPTTGFSLNGQPYRLEGVDFHQDRLNEGWAISDADQTQDVSLIQQMGATFVRLSHYQHAPLTYQLLDQDGIAAWSEIPMNGTNNGNMPGTQSFLDNAKQQLQEMIRQNYNHPSVIVWGLYNEINDNATNDSIITALNTLAHQEDPTRLTTAANNQSPTGPLAAITDVVSFNEYFGWYSGSLSDFAPWLASTHASLPTTAFGISEYGAGASINQHQDNPPEPANGGPFHPEEYQDLFHEAYWAAISAESYTWETTVWNMFDFASDGRNEGDTPGRNDKGLVTYDRQTKKDAVYFDQANWSNSPVIYITGHTWTQRSASAEPIKIYANMDSVTLTVNGQLIGTIAKSSAPDDVFLWNSISLPDGTNTLSVTGTRNGQTNSDTLTFTNSGPLPHVNALTGTPFAHINFGAANATTYPGYDSDNGLAFGLRSDGLSYGWNANNSNNTRVRNNPISPDNRYDTLIQMQTLGTWTWQIAVPNGTYDVHLVGGDPSFTDTTYGLDLEGKLALSGTPTTANHWVESYVRVTVTDGFLTLSNDSSASNNKIDYIDINTAAGTTVTNLNNSGAGSLRQVLTDADTAGIPETITFAAGLSGAISLATPLPTPNANITVQGVGVSLSGNGTVLTIPATISATLQDFTLAAGMMDNEGNLVVLGNSLIYLLTGAGSLTIGSGSNGGRLVLGSASNGTSSQGSLTLNAGAAFDIGNQSFLINYGSAANDPVSAVRGQLAIGQAGNWSGAGIISSAAAGNPQLAIAYADGNTGAAPNQLLLRTAINGDANLDGHVDLTDLSVVLNNFGAANATWTSGAFDYSSSVSLTDLSTVLNNFGNSAPAASIAVVPPPPAESTSETTSSPPAADIGNSALVTVTTDLASETSPPAPVASAVPASHHSAPAAIRSRITHNAAKKPPHSPPPKPVVKPRGHKR